MKDSETNEDWIRISALCLSKIHYAKREIEKFYLEIGQISTFDENKEKDCQVLYYNAIESLVKKSPKEMFVKDELINILRNKLEWNFAANEISKQTLNGEVEIFWEIPRNDTTFVGRLKKLKEIENFLNKEKESTVIVVCTGLGGIGKTSLVKEYVWRNIKKFKIIAWFNVEINKVLLKTNSKVKSINSDLINQICEFGYKHEICKKGNEDDKNEIEKIIKWFEGKSNWLIVFDNVENESSVIEYIPKRGGKILITSRYENFTSICTMIGITKFTIEEVNEYFAKLMPNIYENTTESIIKEFAKRFDYHPFSIAHASSYIKHTNISIQDYLELTNPQMSLMSISEKVSGIIREFNESFKLLQPIYEALMVSVKKVDKEALECLNKCAFYLPENIPRVLFDEDVLLQLKEFSLLTLNDKYFFSVHRLLQDCIKLNLLGIFTENVEEVNLRIKETLICEKFESAFNLIESYYPIGHIEGKDLQLKKHLLPHLECLVTQFVTNISLSDNLRVRRCSIQSFIFSSARDSKTNELFNDAPLDLNIENVKRVLNHINTNKKSFCKLLSKKYSNGTKQEIISFSKTNMDLLNEIFAYIEASIKILPDLNDSKRNREYFKICIKKARERFDLSFQHDSSNIIKNYIDDAVINECEGFFHGRKGERTAQYEKYLYAYCLQFDYFSRDNSEEMPKVIWEQNDIITSNEKDYEHVRISDYRNDDKMIIIGKVKIKNTSFYLPIPIHNGTTNSQTNNPWYRLCGKKVYSTTFEILKMKSGTYKWEASSNGKWERKAVPGGYLKGEVLYIGRVRDKNKLLIYGMGYVQHSKGGCMASIFESDKEKLFNEYEILIGV